eukprot:EG_transcript_15421
MEFNLGPLGRSPLPSTRRLSGAAVSPWRSPPPRLLAHSPAVPCPADLLAVVAQCEDLLRDAQDEALQLRVDLEQAAFRASLAEQRVARLEAELRRSGGVLRGQPPGATLGSTPTSTRVASGNSALPTPQTPGDVPQGSDTRSVGCQTDPGDDVGSVRWLAARRDSNELRDLQAAAAEESAALRGRLRCVAEALEGRCGLLAEEREGLLTIWADVAARPVKERPAQPAAVPRQDVDGASLTPREEKVVRLLADLADRVADTEKMVEHLYNADRPTEVEVEPETHRLRQRLLAICHSLVPGSPPMPTPQLQERADQLSAELRDLRLERDCLLERLTLVPELPEAAIPAAALEAELRQARLDLRQQRDLSRRLRQQL